MRASPPTRASAAVGATKSVAVLGRGTAPALRFSELSYTNSSFSPGVDPDQWIHVDLTGVETVVLRHGHDRAGWLYRMRVGPSLLKHSACCRFGKDQRRPLRSCPSDNERQANTLSVIRRLRFVTSHTSL